MGRGGPADDELAQLIRAGARRSLQAYRDRIVVVGDGDAVVPAVMTRELPGHSPGHVVYEIAGGGQRLVCWGDVCHHPVLLADPGLSFVFDHDPEQAVRSRRRLLAGVADGATDVLAYHLPFPGLGRVVRSGDAGYAWVPRLGSG